MNAVQNIIIITNDILVILYSKFFNLCLDIKNNIRKPIVKIFLSNGILSQDHSSDMIGTDNK